MVEVQELVGTTVGDGRYEVKSHLGEGGMAVIYLAHDRNLDTEVVIKFPHRSMLTDENFIKRFAEENRALVKLRHPYVVSIFDVGKHDSVPFLVMQYLSGGTLLEKYQSGTFDSNLSMLPKWLPQIAAALDFIHSKGFMHRDVKPENIFFDENRIPFLGDFGIVKAISGTESEQLSQNLTQMGHVISTPHYSAPELMSDRQVDGRVDQYALGVTIYELLTKRRPFESTNINALFKEILFETPSELHELVDGVSESFSRVISRSLAKDPGERYADCKSFVAALLSETNGNSQAKTSEKVRLQCPDCNTKLVVAANLVGKNPKCPKCKNKIAITVGQDAKIRAQTLSNKIPKGLAANNGKVVRDRTESTRDTAPKSSSNIPTNVNPTPEADEFVSGVEKDFLNVLQTNRIPIVVCVVGLSAVLATFLLVRQILTPKESVSFEPPTRIEQIKTTEEVATEASENDATVDDNPIDVLDETETAKPVDHQIVTAPIENAKVALPSTTIRPLKDLNLPAPKISMPRRSEALQVAIKLIESQHLIRQNLDERIVEQSIQNFAKRFDPYKQYFLQKDIDNLNNNLSEIHREIRKGDLRSLSNLVEIFLQRQGKWRDYVCAVSESGLDFEKDESFKFEQKYLDYAFDMPELRDRWRRRLKYTLLVSQKESDSLASTLEQTLNSYASTLSEWKKVILQERRLADWFIEDLVISFDQHSSFLPPSALSRTSTVLAQTEFFGIGATLQMKNGLGFVAHVLPGGPADRSGQIRDGDLILAVSKEGDGNFESVESITLDELVSLVRGPKDTLVQLKIKREGSVERVVGISRGKIEDQQLLVNSSFISLPGQSRRIGIIKIPTLYRNPDGATAFEDTQSELKKFIKNQVDLVLLDLRGNNGGSLSEAIKISGLFIGNRPVIQVKGRDNKIQKYDTGVMQVWKNPVVVLTDELTASGAEIIAGSIKDYKRGIVVGSKTTIGVGLVATIVNLNETVNSEQDLGLLKLSHQKLFRVNGSSIHGQGVYADISIPSVLDLVSSNGDEIGFSSTATLNVTPFENFVDEEKLRTIQRKSTRRRKNSEKFKTFAREFRLFAQANDAIEIPLNRKEYRRWLEKRTKNRLPFTDLERVEERKEFIMEELYQIASDYLTELAG